MSEVAGAAGCQYIKMQVIFDLSASMARGMENNDPQHPDASYKDMKRRRDIRLLRRMYCTYFISMSG